jgi:hypothetical protein
MSFNERSAVLYPMGADHREATLALDTGGKIVAARRATDLTTIYEQIAADMRSLYRVGYVPSPLVRDAAWHQVQVRADRQASRPAGMGLSQKIF